MLSDQSSLGFRVGHRHIQTTDKTYLSQETIGKKYKVNIKKYINNKCGKGWQIVSND